MNFTLGNIDISNQFIIIFREFVQDQPLRLKTNCPEGVKCFIEPLAHGYDFDCTELTPKAYEETSHESLLFDTRVLDKAGYMVVSTTIKTRTPCHSSSRISDVFVRRCTLREAILDTHSPSSTVPLTLIVDLRTATTVLKFSLDPGVMDPTMGFGDRLSTIMRRIVYERMTTGQLPWEFAI
jgi:hypothetical protein